MHGVIETIGIDWSDAEYFASEEWLKEKFGLIQEGLSDEGVNVFVLDFSRVYWVDPLPLMAIFAESAIFLKAKKSRRLILRLGRILDTPNYTSRTRKYLVKHQWIAAFCNEFKSEITIECESIDGDRRIIQGNEDEWLKKLYEEILQEKGIDLLYSSEVLITPKILSSDNWEDVIAKAVENVDDEHFRRSAERKIARGTLLQRLRAVLRELVRNAVDHAYRNDENIKTDDTRAVRPILIYARTRNKTENEKTLIKAKKPRSRGSHLEPMAEDQPWIEVCVLDVGQGLWRDAQQWCANSLISEEIRAKVRKAVSGKNPDSVLSGLIWEHNLSRYKRDPETIENVERGRISGLMYLNRVLGSSGDWSHWYSGSSWRYDRHPANKSAQLAFSNASKKEYAFRGTCYRVSLNTITDEMAVPEAWFEPARNSRGVEYLISKLDNYSSAIEVDTAFEESIVLDLRAPQQERQAVRKKMEHYFHLLNSQGRIVRVPRSFDKNAFVKCINEWLNSLAFTTKGLNQESTTPVLVIADLSRAQAINLWLSMDIVAQQDDEWIRLKSQCFPDQAKLLVICDDLASFEIVFYSKMHQAILSDGLVSQSYSIRINTKNNPGKQNEVKYSKGKDSLDRIVWTLKLLREWDSLLFWNRVRDLHSTADACLWPNVKWGDSKLAHYLDFAAAMKDRDLARILRRAFRRIVALFPASSVICMDSLTEGLVADAKWWFSSTSQGIPMGDSSRNTLLVGSVRVTGETLNKYLSLTGESICAIVDCFTQPTFSPIGKYRAETNEASALFPPELRALNWIPWDLEVDETFDLEQEPGTPFIRRSMSRLPSFVDIRSEGRFGSQRLPDGMYQSFSVNGLLKLGHWSLGDKHSHIELDANSAIKNFETDFAPEEGFDFDFFGWLSAELRERIYKERQCPIVVYIPNRLTQRIVWVLKTNKVLMAIPFVPIHITSGVAGGIGLLSDMSLFSIERAAHSLMDMKEIPSTGFDPHRSARDDQWEVPIVVLDVGFVSKKTLRHVRRQLTINGFRDIRAIGLLNRSSSPAHLNEKMGGRIDSYWRWNVPVLGRSSQCVLCSALRTFDVFYEQVSITQTHLIASMKAIKEDWICVSMADMWRDRGVSPISLSHSKQVKLGFESSWVHGEEVKRWHFVNHRQSTTLSAHYIELIRYSGNERLLLDAIVKDREIFSPVVSLECISTLLILCGNSMIEGVRLSYVSELIDSVLRVNEDLLTSGEFKNYGLEFRRAEKLVGLALLTVLSLNDGMRNLVEGLVERRTNVGAIKPSTSGKKGRSLPFIELFLSACLQKRMREKRLKVLQAPPVHRVWRLMMYYFGRGVRHRGYAVERLEDLISQNKIQECSGLIYQIASFVSECDVDLLNRMEIFPIQKFELRSSLKCAEFLSELSRALYIRSGDVVARLDDARELFDLMRSGFRKSILRCPFGDSDGHGEMSLATLVGKAIARDIGLTEKIGYPGLKHLSSNTMSIIWCSRTRHLLKELIENATRVGKPCRHYSDVSQKAILHRVWILVADQSRGIEITIENMAPKGAVPAVECPVFLRDLGGRLVARKIHGDDWYSVSVFLPSIESFA